MNREEERVYEESIAHGADDSNLTCDGECFLDDALLTALSLLLWGLRDKQRH